MLFSFHSLAQAARLHIEILKCVHIDRLNCVCVYVCCSAVLFLSLPRQIFQTVESYEIAKLTVRARISTLTHTHIYMNTCVRVINRAFAFVECYFDLF